MACREFEMGRVCMLNTELNKHCPCRAICQIPNCKNNLPRWMRMPILIFVYIENSGCDCFSLLTALHYYLGVISVEYTRLYRELYQWSVFWSHHYGKKSCSLQDAGQLSKSWVWYSCKNYLLNTSAIFLWPEKGKCGPELWTPNFHKNQINSHCFPLYDACLRICRQSWNSCPTLQSVFWLYLLVIWGFGFVFLLVSKRKDILLS